MIYYATQYGLEKLAKQLVSFGTDVNIKNKDDDTPLHQAARQNNRDMAELLIVNGAEVCPKNMNGNTPLHEAAGADFTDMAKLLISYGAEINSKNWGEITPLHYAASRNYMNMILLLIANGADVNTKDKDGDTPLHAAALKGHLEIAKFLLAHGADINAEDESGNIPLDEAVRRGHEEICQLLKKQALIVNTNDKTEKVSLGLEVSISSENKAEPVDDTKIKPGLEALRVQSSPISDAMIAKQNEKNIIRDNSAFAFDLYQQLRTDGGNLFFSPYSISTALALVYAGARGDTEKQMAQTLHFSLEKDSLHLEFAGLQDELNQIQKAGDVKLCIANSFWPQKDNKFLDEFLSLAKKYYGVSVLPVDYKRARDAALTMINTWVENRTENKIKDLIQSEDLMELTRFVLVNAIYFRGNWENQFDPDDTEDAPFYILPSKSIQTPMMTQEEYVKYARVKSLQIVQISYRGDDISMLVLLPNERDGLEQLEQILSVDNLEFWRQRLEEKKVIIYLPKFMVTCTFNLKEKLVDMGIVDAFKYPDADFSGMDGSHELYISKVIHKAFLNVNEEGTEAAAATAIIGGIGGVGPPPSPVFRADHPFLFMIQENKTGSILFIGRVTDPTKDGQS